MSSHVRRLLLNWHQFQSWMKPGISMNQTREGRSWFLKLQHQPLYSIRMRQSKRWPLLVGLISFLSFVSFQLEKYIIFAHQKDFRILKTLSCLELCTNRTFISIRAESLNLSLAHPYGPQLLQMIYVMGGETVGIFTVVSKQTSWIW